LHPKLLKSLAQSTSYYSDNNLGVVAVAMAQWASKQPVVLKVQQLPHFL